MIRGELCKVVLWEKGMFDEISERVRSERREAYVMRVRKYFLLRLVLGLIVSY